VHGVWVDARDRLLWRSCLPFLLQAPGSSPKINLLLPPGSGGLRATIDRSRVRDRSIVRLPYRASNCQLGAHIRAGLVRLQINAPRLRRCAKRLQDLISTQLVRISDLKLGTGQWYSFLSVPQTANWAGPSSVLRLQSSVFSLPPSAPPIQATP
jgi:hypothetical protein